MASRCPKCQYKFGMLDFKAECPVCGVNIPNFDWENRLELDSVKADDSWLSFRRKINSFKKAIFGNKSRIARFVLTFAPALFVLFPMFTVNVNLPFSQGSEKISALNLILSIVNGEIDIGSTLSFASLPRSGGSFKLLYASIALVVLGFLAGVANFFVLLLSGIGYHVRGNIICCSLSSVFFAGAIVLILAAGSSFKSSIPEIVALKLSIGLFVGLAFFILNLVLSFMMKKQFQPEKEEYRKLTIAELEKRLSE